MYFYALELVGYPVWHLAAIGFRPESRVPPVRQQRPTRFTPVAPLPSLFPSDQLLSPFITIIYPKRGTVEGDRSTNKYYDCR